MRRALFVGLFLIATCEVDKDFFCVIDSDCAGGSCEPNNFCSFFDPTCPSGRRYIEESGELSNQCVDDVPPILDGPPGDGSGSGSPPDGAFD